MDTLDIGLRLGAALMSGVVIGINRDFHSKPMGARTLGLVGLGAAVAVIGVLEGGADATSRVIQGVLTGLGFLGAGAIMRIPDKEQIEGLTTAACVWITACIGLVCGMAEWPVVWLSLGFALLVLMLGGMTEKLVQKLR